MAPRSASALVCSLKRMGVGVGVGPVMAFIVGRLYSTRWQVFETMGLREGL